MPSSSKSPLRRGAEFAIAAIPWIIAMYTFYWLDSSGTWTSDTPHRGKLSVAILGTGMLASFFVWSLLSRHRPK